MKVKFAHIINTVSPEDNPSLGTIQQLTLNSLFAAKENAKGSVEVELLSAQFENARKSLPEGIRATENLKECAAERKELNTKKKFPLLREILSRLNESPDATHFIYTNLDICVMPFFYEVVSTYLGKGYDAIVINRRRISARFLNEKNMSPMYAELGKVHLGYDCFIFSRELLAKFILKDIFIGTPPAGGDLFHNLFTFAKNPVLLTEKHLTFHVGMELTKKWGDPDLNRFNQEQFRLLLKEIAPSIDISKFPGANYGFFKRHFKWLMNPTFHYPTLARADFRQFGRKRKKIVKNEVAGSRANYHEWLVKQINFRDED